MSEINKKSFSKKQSLLGVLILSLGLLNLCGCIDDKRNQALGTTNPMANRVDIENPPPRPTEGTRTEADPKIKMDKEHSSELPNATEIEIPYYPTAKPLGDETGTLKITKRANGMISVVMETEDSLADVQKFYRKELPKASELPKTNEGAKIVTFMQPIGEGGMKSVEIREFKGKTQISLLRLSGMEIPTTSKSEPSATSAIPPPLGTSPIPSTSPEPAPTR